MTPGVLASGPERLLRERRARAAPGGAADRRRRRSPGSAAGSGCPLPRGTRRAADRARAGSGRATRATGGELSRDPRVEGADHARRETPHLPLDLLPVRHARDALPDAGELIRPAKEVLRLVAVRPHAEVRGDLLAGTRPRASGRPPAGDRRRRPDATGKSASRTIPRPTTALSGRLTRTPTPSADASSSTVRRAARARRAGCSARGCPLPRRGSSGAGGRRSGDRGRRPPRPRPASARELVASGSSHGCATVFDETPYHRRVPAATRSSKKRKAALEPAIELVPGSIERPPAVMGGVGQEVLGVVEQADVERLEAQAVEGPRQLVLEERRMHAVPAVRLVVDHLGERAIGAPRAPGPGRGSAPARSRSSRRRRSPRARSAPAGSRRRGHSRSAARCRRRCSSSRCR